MSLSNTWVNRLKKVTIVEHIVTCYSVGPTAVIISVLYHVKTL